MDTKNTSMLPDNPETVCPSCGRFVGTYERCPYCGRDVKKRFTIRFMKIASIVMALVGVFFLYLAALHKQLPLIRVSEVKPTMNFAYVRVRGIATSDAYINDWGGFGFKINDSDDGKDIDSEINIKAYSNIAKELKDRNIMPSAGDIVEVAGSLKVREGSKTLTIQSPEQIKIFPAKINKMNISELNDESLIGQRILIHGEILDFIPTPGKAPKEIVIQDQESSVKLKCWNKVYQEVSKLKGMGYGAIAEVKIYVDQYRGKIQYWLKKTNDIKIKTPSKKGIKVGTSTFKKKTLAFGDIINVSDIDKSYIKKTVTIKGVVTNIFKFGKTNNHKAIINDNGSNIEVIMFSKSFPELPYDVKKGNVLKICGVAGEYKGKMQIIPRSKENIKFISKGNVSNNVHYVVANPKTSDIVKISQITEAMKGNIVQFSGKIIATSTFGKKNNHKAIIEDEGSNIEVIFFASNFKELPSCMTNGNSVKITGKVNVYRKKLQIIVDKPVDVEVL